MSKTHVVEPYELPQRQRGEFWEEAMVAAHVLATLFRPVKMNYEVHGNVVPHLHLHLYPRYADDPYDTGALRPRSATFTRTEDDLRRIADAMRTASARFRAA